MSIFFTYIHFFGWKCLSFGGEISILTNSRRRRNKNNNIALWEASHPVEERERKRENTHTHKMYSGEYGINRSDLNLWFKLKVPFTDIVVEWNFINLTSFFPKAFEAFYMCLGAFWLENMRSIVKKISEWKESKKAKQELGKSCTWKYKIEQSFKQIDFHHSSSVFPFEHKAFTCIPNNNNMHSVPGKKCACRSLTHSCRSHTIKNS